MLTLVLDQASKTSGYSIWKDNELIKYGAFTYHDTNQITRIVKLGQRVNEIIETLGIQELVIENIQLEQGVGNNVATFQILAQLQGILHYVAFINNIPCYMLRPSEWRSRCGFLKGQKQTRQQQKKIAQEWVLKQYNYKCTQDEADAICIGYAHTHQPKELNWE